MARIDLSKPIKPGFRRPITLTADEDVESPSVAVTEGDSTASIRPESAGKNVLAYLNGDGSLGTKTVVISADGKIGAGEATITQEIGYVVAHPDATEFVGGVTEGTDEPIPT